MSRQANGIQTGSRDYETPPGFHAMLVERFGAFDLDPCCYRRTKKARMFFDARMDGLSQDWFGNVFMNPPWGSPEHPCKCAHLDAPDSKCKKACQKRGRGITRLIPGIEDWVAKAVREVRAGHAGQVVGLIPSNNTDSSWWHQYILERGAHEVYLVRGRIAFLLDGEPKSANAVSNAVVIWRQGRPPRFPKLGTLPANPPLAQAPIPEQAGAGSVAYLEGAALPSPPKAKGEIHVLETHRNEPEPLTAHGGTRVPGAAERLDPFRNLAF